MRTRFWVPGLLLLGASSALLAASNFDVRDFGAKGDGSTKDTAAIQKAIDAAEKQGGGTVTLPPGNYLSGTIHLKSNVTLFLSNGATLLASPDNADFDPYETLPFKSVSDNETTYFHYGLVTAENVHHIAILGQGTIDGNRPRRRGPKTVSIKLCRFVTIRGITVQNSPNYSISFWGTDYIDIDGVTILNGYADGIDPDASRYVRISNCYIDCFDDAICPKASPSMGMENRRSTEHLTVTNCVLRTNCSNFKFGTESSGDLKDVTVSNCTMFPREKGRRPISGISLESVDGANIDGVVISNISMAGIETPIFVRLGNRGRGLNPPVPGSAQNISISNILVRGASMASSVTGIPGYPVRRVSLSNIVITMEGGNHDPKGLEVPEHIAKYPEGNMFGVLPAYGFYGRHAEGLALSNIHTRWDKEDLRPAMIFDDVKDLTVDGFRTDTVAGSSSLVWMNNVIGALIRGSRPALEKGLLRVSGAESKGIITQ
ncbi:MAG: right-handed parallel beta-helix repeat-containing protein [Acidobacteria bacterium]|nr:right-handed parallel beta-helix repeat-containing protein [Acidobacteriota bacterium]